MRIKAVVGAIATWSMFAICRCRHRFLFSSPEEKASLLVFGFEIMTRRGTHASVCESKRSQAEIDLFAEAMRDSRRRDIDIDARRNSRRIIFVPDTGQVGRIRLEATTLCHCLVLEHGSHQQLCTYFPKNLL